MSVHRLGKSLLPALVAAFVVVPADAQICTPFTDVAFSNPFCGNIQWMLNRGITSGCGANLFCPNDFMPREQMAAFMNRLGNIVFQQGGNAFGTTAILGTTDNRALHVNVNGSRALRVAPASNGAFGSVPNLVGGHPGNNAAVTCIGICIPTPEPVVGAVIAGGGPTPGGLPNRVTDSFGVVGGGIDNQAGNDDADHLNAVAATIGGGVSNVARGAYSTVPGGVENEARGAFSFAAGRRARATTTGCFVWSDAVDISPIITSCSAANQFVATAHGGVYFYSEVDPNAGVQLHPGASSWSMISDRAMKANVVPVDAEAMLERVATMPLATWNYVTQSPDIRHVGPMAQDFHAAFGVGEDERLISTVDAQGVALAAIQGLAARDRARARSIEALEARNAALEMALRELAAEVRAMKTSLRVE